MQPHRDTFELTDADYREIAAMERAINLDLVDLQGKPDDAAWEQYLRRSDIRNRAARATVARHTATVRRVDSAQMEMAL